MFALILFFGAKSTGESYPLKGQSQLQQITFCFLFLEETQGWAIRVNRVCKAYDSHEMLTLIFVICKDMTIRNKIF